MAGETDNLARSMMTATQSSKFQTSNDADGQIDAAITASKTVLVTNTNAASIAAADFRRGVEFVLTNGSPVPTAAITITIPAVVRGLFVVRNTTSYTATIGISGQPVTAPTLVTLGKAVFHCDGTNVRILTSDPAALGTMSTQNANNVAITGGTITGMGTPSAGSDVATKTYVDTEVSNGGLNALTACQFATAAVLPNSPTYSNGTAGVGATLTAGSNAAIVVDGSSPILNDRVLVKNQASAFQNGVYSVTTVGSGAAAWVLTRVTDFDQAAEMLRNSFAYIQDGATNIGSSWLLDAAVTTVGTDPLDFVQFAGSGGGSSGFNPYAAKVPDSSQWTQVNFTGATVTEASVSAGLTQALHIKSTTPGASRAVQGLRRAVPSTPYRIVTAIRPRLPAQASTGYALQGIGWTDGTKLQLLEIFNDNLVTKLTVGNYNTVSSFNGDQAGFPINFYQGFNASGEVWLALSDDGTNVAFQGSGDGVYWWDIYNVAKSSGFLGSSGYTNAIFMVDGLQVGTQTNVESTLICWDETGLNRTLTSVYG